MIHKILYKLSLLSEDGKLSITNSAVCLFIAITAFRSLFSGVNIEYNFINWKVEALDLSSILPLLFALINYGHKRIEVKKNVELSGKTLDEKVE